MNLTTDTLSHVICNCEIWAAIKQARPLWYGGLQLKCKYGEALQIDYTTLLKTHQGKCYMLTMVETIPGRPDTHPAPGTTAQNTILGLEKQVLQQHGTPEGTESDNISKLVSQTDTRARMHKTEGVYPIPYHVPAPGKIEQYNRLLETTLKAVCDGAFKHWNPHLQRPPGLVNTRGFTNRAGPAQCKPPRTVEGDEVSVVHLRNISQIGPA